MSVHDMNERTISLIGKDAHDILKASSVIVFGLGGVGGICAEALARSGIGEMAIVDFDTIDITNINRQVAALESTIGKFKADVMKERMLDINPSMQLKAYKEKVTKNEIDLFDISEYNYIIDAIDDVAGKLALIEEAYKYNVPIISSMGTGNKTDPTKFKIGRISNTHTCPLAKKMRKELTGMNLNKDDLKVVYSEEKIKKTDMNRKVPSSISYMPATAGLLIASEVIRGLCDIEGD